MVRNLPAMWESQVSLRGGHGNQPIPVFLPGESNGQGILVGYSPRGCTESDTTEAT